MGRFRSLPQQLLTRRMTNRVLDLLGERGQLFDPLLHHTANVITIQGGDQTTNAIPGAIHVGLNGRLLPGYTPNELLAELRALLREDIEFAVLRYDPAPATQDMGLFDTLAAILREADPTGVPIPMLFSGVTDGRLFAQLGIRTYGFLPMPLPADFNFAQTVHAANERIPLAALVWRRALSGRNCYSARHMLPASR